ncbi:MAG: hypothetical protein F6K19_50225 [Cyanothece sp. SIO1E1]|nr:hypothetical protein [Cyanothece sp. SIO1E1]NET40045.1 hypothetical protein [Cyanothece sp. SIO1E1]
MTELNRYFVEVGKNAYEFQGAKYIYDAIGSTVGVKKVSERSSGASGVSNQLVISTPEAVKRTVPKVRIVMQPDGLGNSAQTDTNRRTRTIDVRCNPDKVDDALQKLPNQTVGGVAGVGDFRIVRAYIPLRRCFV